MEAKNRVVAIVPAYNEARAIGGVIDDLLTHNVSPIVVNDGSSDATLQIAKEKGVIVLNHIFNRGQGASLATGIVKAISLNAEIIITFDSDGQHQAKDIAGLIKPIIENKADIVLGSRFLSSNDIPIIKRVLLKFAILYTRLLTGLNITDTHNGLRAMNIKAALKIALKQSGMAHASEILDIISKKKIKFVEVPVSIVYSPYSLKKGQKLSNSFAILFDLWFK